MNADTIYESQQFFLEDEPYETVPHLVRGYVGVERAVSAASGARLRRPVNRTAALGPRESPRPASVTDWRRSLLTRRAGSAEHLTAGPLGCCGSTGGSLPRLPSGPLYQQPGRLRADRPGAAAVPPPKPCRPEGRVPEPRPGSVFDPSSFESLLLPVGQSVGPLDAGTLRAVTVQLLETEPGPLAAALTACDLRLLHGEEGRGLELAEPGLGVASGIELLTLPQGRQLRLDLLER